MKTVEQVLTEMLTECTGAALCDSGGAYGRNWERNQGKIQEDFENEKDVTLEYDNDGNVEYYTISVYHYLKNQLGRDSVCERFDKLNTQSNNWDDDRFYGVSAEAGDFLDRVGIVDSGGTFNSYNGESLLSQVIQGTHLVLRCHGGQRLYVILQIHGGCDVRGGYTNARLFTLESDYAYDCGYMAPENVYGTFTPNSADLKTLCFDGQVDPEVAGVIYFSNCYDGYSLNRIHNNWREFELNKNKGKIEVWLAKY